MKAEPNLELVDEALTREGLPNDGEAEERTARLKAHYESLPNDKLADCDVCGFPSPAEEPACAFCGHSDTSETAIVETASAELGDLVEAERRLDAAIGRYASAGRDMVGSGWDMGNAAREIRESKLYLARRGGKGEPIHRNFEEFCRTELRRSSTDVRRMIDVASNFTREEAVQVGTTKLGITLRIMDPEKRAPLLEMARDPEVSVRQLSEATREAAKGQDESVDRLGRARGPRSKTRAKGPIFPPAAPFLGGRKPEEDGTKEAAPKRTRRLTLSVEEGDHQVLLYAQRTSPGDKRRAREIADGPCGRLRFLNGTQMRIRIRRGENGLVARVEFTEAPEEDQEA